MPNVHNKAIIQLNPFPSPRLLAGRLRDAANAQRLVSFAGRNCQLAGAIV